MNTLYIFAPSFTDMTIKHNKSTLKKLEEIFSAADFKIRYEKGHFQSGYCILHDKKIIVVNKFFKLKGRIDSLLDILHNVEIAQDKLTSDQREIMISNEKIYAEELKLAS